VTEKQDNLNDINQFENELNSSIDKVLQGVEKKSTQDQFDAFENVYKTLDQQVRG
jgi:hypothetical protein